MGLGACGGGIGDDCGEGLAILLCLKSYVDKTSRSFKIHSVLKENSF